MTNAEILLEARENFEIAAAAEFDVRAESDKCLSFLALDQWDQGALDARGPDKPSLTIDQLGQFKDQVVNDWRRNRLGIKTTPVDSVADPETAKKLDGLIRNIEYQSKAHVAYDTAFDYMCGGNRGYFGISTKRREGSFKQEIVIRRFQNPDAIYLDPFAKEINYSDMQWAFVRDKMSIPAFKKSWKNASVTDFTPYMAGESDARPNWVENNAIYVAEYWRVEEIPRTIQTLTQKITVERDGKYVNTDVVYDDEYDEKDLPDGVEVAKDADGERMEDDEPKRVVWKYILNGVEVLEKTRWAGQYIPIIPMMGRELYVKGKRKLFSLVSRALDAQRSLNYYESGIANAVQMMGKFQWYGYVGQFKTMRDQMQVSNQTNFAFMEFDPLIVGDKPVPLPSLNNYEPPIQALVVGSQRILELMKGNFGMYSASLGKEVGHRSGIAEKALQSEGDNASFDFLDNGARALEHAGCVIVDLIPKIYDTADVIRILGEDNTHETVAINQDVKTMEIRGQKPPEGQDRSFYFDTGKYDVAVQAAPSHATQRQEGAEFALQVLHEALPEQKAKLLPVVLRQQDFYGADQLADAIDPSAKNGKVDPAQVQQMQQQAQQVIQAMQQTIDKLLQEKQAKQEEMDAKVQMNRETNDVKLAIANITAKTEKTAQDVEMFTTRMDHMLQILEQSREMAHQASQQEQQLSHAADQGAQQADLQREQMAQSQQTEGQPA